MVLVDTDVLVDCLRGSVAAKSWLDTFRNEDFAIPGAAAMEFVIGCRNQADLQQIRKFLASFNVTWPDASEFAQSHELLATHRRSLGISIPDCLLAATALVKNLVKNRSCFMP
jgi:predicted nucleic acid-binding protein